MVDSYTSSERKLARRAWLLGALVVALGCGPQGGAGEATRKRKIAGKIDLPPGVFWDVESKIGVSHSPSCTIENDGDDIVLSVAVGFGQTAEHHVQELRVVGPGPAFREILRYRIERTTGPWKLEFRIPRKSLPEGTRYLIVYVTCNRHGSFGVSQAV